MAADSPACRTAVVTWLSMARMSSDISRVERAVALEKIASYPQILYEEGSNTRRVQNELFGKTDQPLTVAMETENVEITKAMVGARLGISLIPYAAIAREVRAGQLAIIRVRGQRLYRQAGWVYLKTDYVPPPVSALLELFDSMKKAFRSVSSAS